jgi:serine/threonine-protein kinase HipA
MTRILESRFPARRKRQRYCAMQASGCVPMAPRRRPTSSSCRSGRATRALTCARQSKTNGCAHILRAYGVDAADCWMDQFGPHKVLVVERFDRRLARNERWFVRLPQEDLCQTTGTDRDHRYEADGGPGIQKAMNLLLGSARADHDRVDFFRTQILFWMLCAIDGHAKNFSLFLEAGGQFRLTPRYDVLSAFPVLGNRAGQLSPHKVKMAMAVQGEGRRHYNWNSIQPRHWVEMAKRCGLATQIDSLMEDLAAQTPQVIDTVTSQLPKKFPSSVANPILNGIRQSARKLATKRMRSAIEAGSRR